MVIVFFWFDFHRFLLSSNWFKTTTTPLILAFEHSSWRGALTTKKQWVVLFELSDSQRAPYAYFRYFSPLPSVNQMSQIRGFTFFSWFGQLNNSWNFNPVPDIKCLGEIFKIGINISFDWRFLLGAFIMRDWSPQILQIVVKLPLDIFDISKLVPYTLKPVLNFIQLIYLNRVLHNKSPLSAQLVVKLCFIFDFVFLIFFRGSLNHRNCWLHNHCLLL